MFLFVNYGHNLNYYSSERAETSKANFPLSAFQIKHGIKKEMPIPYNRVAQLYSARRYKIYRK
jgi:hypothetical protein